MRFCYLGDTIEARECAGECTLERVKNGWGKCRDLLPSVISRHLDLGVKVRLYSTYVCSVTIYVIETLLVKESDVIGLEKVTEG